MASIFTDMAIAAGSAFMQQQTQISTSTTDAASSSAQRTSSCATFSPILSSSIASNENGVVVFKSSSNLHCASLRSSPTSSSSMAQATGMLADCFSAVPVAPSLPVSQSFSSASSSTPESTAASHVSTNALLSTSVSATTTSAHQLLMNGLGVRIDDSMSNVELSINAVNSSSLVEDPRTLQLALELSMVGLNDTMQVQQQQQLQQLQQQHLHHMQKQTMSQQQLHQQTHQQSSSFDIGVLSAAVAAAAAAAATNSQVSNSVAVQLNQYPSTMLPALDDRSKKSQNMTECVPVPSSEHVAEIVGRQGCKIKALRAKTNTYIKTPVRGEEPVFVVTGRKEDVARAKREILSAAEHFSVIRASRKPSLAGSIGCSLNDVGSGACGGKAPPGPSVIPGQITIQVRVPYRVVGLVVGPKGATIKHIQQETQTYIVTPSREKEPIFAVTGQLDNVQAARKQIEAHIALRTGNLSTADEHTSVTATSQGGHAVHTINSLSQILCDDVSPEFLQSIYKNGLCSTFDYVDSNAIVSMPLATHNNNASQSLMQSNTNNFQLQNAGNDFLNNMLNACAADNTQQHVFSNSHLNNANGTVELAGGVCVSSANGISRSCSSASSTTSSKSANNGGGSNNSSRPELSSIWKNMGGTDTLDVDEGIGESPSIWTLPSNALTSTLGSHSYSPTTSISPTDSLLGEGSALSQLLAIQTQQQQQRGTVNRFCSSKKYSFVSLQQQHLVNQQQQQNLGLLRRECLVCGDREVTAALVPCGHNMFCMECAHHICSATDEGACCPICSQSVIHAMRILP